MIYICQSVAPKCTLKNKQFKLFLVRLKHNGYHLVFHRLLMVHDDFFGDHRTLAIFGFKLEIGANTFKFTEITARKMFSEQIINSYFTVLYTFQMYIGNPKQTL